MNLKNKRGELILSLFPNTRIHTQSCHLIATDWVHLSLPVFRTHKHIHREFTMWISCTCCWRPGVSVVRRQRKRQKIDVYIIHVSDKENVSQGQDIFGRNSPLSDCGKWVVSHHRSGESFVSTVRICPLLFFCPSSSPPIGINFSSLSGEKLSVSGSYS